jgi:HK97 gp10 family phage protein
MPERVEVIGAKELAKTFKKLGLDMKDLRDAGKLAAEPVASTARSIAPRLTGAMEASIRTGGQQAGGTVIGGSAKAKHFPFVHFGVPVLGMAPRPILYDALDQRRDDVQKVYEDSIDKLIKDNDLT